jgi:hypothetical protein
MPADRTAELIDFVLALETSILGKAPSDAFVIRVDVLRALLVSWHELRAIANLSPTPRPLLPSG